MERQTVVEQKCINSCWKGSSRKGPSIVSTFIWRQWQCLTLVLVLVLVLDLVLVLALALNNTNEYFETVGFLAPSQCGALQCLKKKREKDAANVSPSLNKGDEPLNNLHFLFLGKSM